MEVWWGLGRTSKSDFSDRGRHVDIGHKRDPGPINALLLVLIGPSRYSYEVVSTLLAHLGVPDLQLANRCMYILR